jgi:outer membrane protein OmpA-like peptidoglycan-associated protein
MDADFSRGGVAAGEDLKHRIRSFMDSLATTTETRESLESQLGSAQTELADAHNRITEMQKRISDLERDRASAQSDLSKRQVVAERLRTAQSFFEPADATLLQDEEGRVIIRVYGIQFASGATTLTKSQQKLVETLAKAIQSFPEAVITVEGHTDSDGSEDGNQKLSEKRASSVGKLLEKTLPVSYSPPKIIGYGESKPIADNKPPH